MERSHIFDNFIGAYSKSNNNMNEAEINPALGRLEEQCKWYSEKSAENKRWFQSLKVIEIVAAAVIPFAAGYSGLTVLTGLLGVLIVVLEGLQGIYQFHDNWIAYRSTNEALKHEKYLWQAKAGPYKDAANPYAMFAERVESLVSIEHAKWVLTQEQTVKVEKI